MQKEINGYKVINFIEKGSFGEIYKVEKNNKILAMKVINTNDFDPQLFQKLMELLNNEINIMKYLNHSNIVKLYSNFEIGYKKYIIMDYCEGDNLRNYLTINHILGYEKKINLIYDIVCGLNELYINDIMHRDIKLENILIKNDKCLIGDWGFAKIGFSKAVTNLGTLIYNAPEILKEDKEYSYEVDVWSVGIIIYYMFFNNFPFYGFSRKEILLNINKFYKEKSYKNLENIDIRIKKLIDITLEVDISKRVSILNLKKEIEKNFKVKFRKNSLKKNIKILNININNNLKSHNIYLFLKFIYDLLINLEFLIFNNNIDKDTISITFIIIYYYLNFLLSKYRLANNHFIELNDNFDKINFNKSITEQYIIQNKQQISKILQMKQIQSNYIKLLKVCFNNFQNFKYQKCLKTYKLVCFKLKLLINPEIILKIISNNQWDSITI